jgi:stage II sporulation protein D
MPTRASAAPGSAAEIVLRGPLTVRRTGSRWSILDVNGAIAPMEGLEGVAVGALAAEEPVVAVGELRYPGSIELSARTDEGDGAFDVINLVPMEDYLPGVVAGELFDHWHFQTRAAQAVAARSFAASERAQVAGRRAYDVTNTPESQVYRGVVTHRETREAVAETRGVVLAYDGRLVSGYYSSCCGGIAASAVDAIGHNPINDVAPLRGRDGMDVCTDAKMARWTVERPVRTLTRRLADWGERRGLPELARLAKLAAIKVAERNPHGRPTRYVLTDDNRQGVELSAYQLRSAANHHGPDLPRPKQPLWSSCVRVTVADPTATFDGRGFGHGVGMCQYGAEILARRGTHYRDILEWYYPQVRLVQAWGQSLNSE